MVGWRRKFSILDVLKRLFKHFWSPLENLLKTEISDILTLFRHLRHIFKTRTYHWYHPFSICTEISEKLIFLSPWYPHVHVCIRGRDVRFSEIFGGRAKQIIPFMYYLPCFRFCTGKIELHSVSIFT